LTNCSENLIRKYISDNFLDLHNSPAGELWTCTWIHGQCCSSNPVRHWVEVWQISMAPLASIAH